MEDGEAKSINTFSSVYLVSDIIVIDNNSALQYLSPLHAVVLKTSNLFTKLQGDNKSSKKLLRS